MEATLASQNTCLVWESERCAFVRLFTSRILSTRERECDLLNDFFVLITLRKENAPRQSSAAFRAESIFQSDLSALAHHPRDFFARAADPRRQFFKIGPTNANHTAQLIIHAPRARTLLISLRATFRAERKHMRTAEQRQIGPTGMRGVNIANFAAMHARALLFMAARTHWIFASLPLARSLCSAHGRKFGGTRVKCQDEAITDARILN